mgnify:CR=1 FL=1
MVGNCHKIALPMSLVMHVIYVSDIKQHVTNVVLYTFSDAQEDGITIIKK